MKGQPDEIQLKAWLDAVSQGDSVAFKHFYDVMAPVIYRFAISRLNDPHEAESIVSDVMLQVWRQATCFEGRARVKTWILGIAYHKIMDVWRQTHHDEDILDTVLPDRQLDQVLSEGESVSIEGENKLLEAACRSCFEACLEQLPPAQRQVLYLVLVEEQPYGEIAQILSCPPNTVKTRVFHAKRFMQKCMADWNSLRIG